MSAPGPQRHGRLQPGLRRGIGSLPGVRVWTPVETATSTRHPLADPSFSSALKERGDRIEQAFGAIEPTLKALVRRQFDENFVDSATDELRIALGLSVPAELLKASWSLPLDVRALYAHCVLGTFCRLIEQGHSRDVEYLVDGASAEDLIRHWGFHSIDITPCADGRMSGVVDYILRVPPAIVDFRKSYAGAMFDVEESLRHWETVELRRWREGRPNAADAATRFLKLGVYHFSSVDPDHQGCAAHGSDAPRAAAALLERLEQWSHAVQLTHGCDTCAAILLVGVDTDTDAIRVHIPDANGTMSVHRFVDNCVVYERTIGLARDAAKDAIRQDVADCMGVSADDVSSEGMRWFCAYLLKNNLAQVDAVRQRHGAAYADRGHTERLIVVGDAVDDVQLRNSAFQSQMDTVEEGAADLDVGVKILRSFHEPRGLAVPVLVHYRFDPRIPGARERAEQRAQRLRTAIESRFATMVGNGGIHVEAVVREGDTGTLTVVERVADSALGFEAHP